MSSTEVKPAPIIFGDEDLSDVTLVVDNQDFKIHKMVLALHSTVFKAMFFGNFKESKENRVEIKEASVENFRRFLEIIYTGKISEPDRYLKFTFGVYYNDHESRLPLTIRAISKYYQDFWNDTTELLNIADRFNVTPLVRNYFESITITALRLCKNETCRQCIHFFIFAILNGMDVSKCEKKYQWVHYKEWLEYADEKPFPDVPNKALKTLLQHFGEYTSFAL